MLLRMDLSAGTDSSSVSQEQPRRPHQNAEPQLIPRSGLVHRENFIDRADAAPKQEARLSQIADHSGTHPERLVKDAALRLLEEPRLARCTVVELGKAVRSLKKFPNRGRIGSEEGKPAQQRRF